MLIRKVKADYLFLNRVDDNDNYRVRITVSEEQKEEIFEAMKKVAKENGYSLEDCEWQGSYKIDENGNHSFNAKCKNTITNRKGETSEYKPRVYNSKAIEMTEVPNIANGAIINIEVNPYFTSYKKKAGVMLGLRSVQLLEYEIYAGANPYKDESEDNPYFGDGDEEKEELPFK